jgi:hypothetical protein
MEAETKPPAIFADRLLEILKKTETELRKMEHVLMDRVGDGFEDSDLKDLGHVMVRLHNILDLLESREVQFGEVASHMIRDEILEPFRDLSDRLIESKSFPEFTHLDEVCR